MSFFFDDRPRTLSETTNGIRFRADDGSLLPDRFSQSVKSFIRLRDATTLDRGGNMTQTPNRFPSPNV